MLLEEVIFNTVPFVWKKSRVITLAVSCFKKKKSKLFTGRNIRVGGYLLPFMALLRWEWPLREHIMFKHQNNYLDHFLTKPWSAFWWGRKCLNHSSFICKHWTFCIVFICPLEHKFGLVLQNGSTKGDTGRYSTTPYHHVGPVPL